MHGKESVMLKESINFVMDLNKEKWLSIPGVLDVMIGRCNLDDCIVVHVDNFDRRMRKLAPPAVVAGYKVRVEKPKELRPLV